MRQTFSVQDQENYYYTLKDVQNYKELHATKAWTTVNISTTGDQDA